MKHLVFILLLFSSSVFAGTWERVDKTTLRFSEDARRFGGIREGLTDFYATSSCKSTANVFNASTSFGMCM